MIFAIFFFFSSFVVCMWWRCAQLECHTPVQHIVDFNFNLVIVRKFMCLIVWLMLMHLSLVSTYEYYIRNLKRIFLSLHLHTFAIDSHGSYTLRTLSFSFCCWVTVCYRNIFHPNRKRKKNANRFEPRSYPKPEPWTHNRKELIDDRFYINFIQLIPR